VLTGSQTVRQAGRQVMPLLDARSPSSLRVPVPAGGPPSARSAPARTRRSTGAAPTTAWLPQSLCPRTFGDRNSLILRAQAASARPDLFPRLL
jgi:hypothetical protein